MNKILLATIMIMVTFINISFAEECDVKIWKATGYFAKGSYNAVKVSNGTVASESVHNVTASELATQLNIQVGTVTAEAELNSNSEKTTYKYKNCFVPSRSRPSQIEYPRGFKG